MYTTLATGSGCLQLLVVALKPARLLHCTTYLSTTSSQTPSSPGTSKGPPRHKLLPHRNKRVESLVGYHSRLQALRYLVGSELKQLPYLAQRLISSQHPVVKKSSLFFETFNSLQSVGLLTLLVSKAINELNPSSPDLDQFGIAANQRALAEISEMINIAHWIHSEVVDDVGGEPIEDQAKLDLQFGNKLLIIGGDVLLARACKELALFYKPQIVSLMSQAICDSMTGMHMKASKPRSSSLHPTHLSDLPLTDEREDCLSLYHRSYYHSASLLYNSCRCSAIIGELETNWQCLAGNIGRHLSILQLATSDNNRADNQEDSLVLEQIVKDTGDEALGFLKQLPNSISKEILIEIVTSHTNA